MDRSTLVRSLGRDKVFLIVAALYLATAASSFAGIVPPIGGDQDLALPVEILLTIVGIRLGLRRSGSATVIAFWNYQAAAFVLRLLALGLVAVGAGGAIQTGLFLDAIDITGYLLVVLASELRPDLNPVYRPPDRAELWRLISTFVFVLSAFTYCSVIPAWAHQEVYLSGRMTTLQDIFLVLFLQMRFAYLGGVAASTTWRWTYRLLFAGMFVLALLLGFRFYVLTIGDFQGTGLRSRLLVVPLFIIFLAARVSRALPREAPPRQVGPRVWESLVFYAFALPLFHLLLHYLGFLDAKSSSAQEGLIILYFVSMGTLALVQATRREKRRHQTSQALRDNEERYRRLIETHPDAILIEQNGSLVYANTTASEKLGLRDTIAELSLGGLGFCGLPNASDMEEQPSKSILPIDCQLRGAGGETLDFEVIYHASSYRGAPAIQAIARDVTETRRRRAEAESTERLAALGKISAAMAHEIRNPLAAIVMHSFYLAERLREDPENLRVLDDINAAADRMQKLVNGILGFVRPAELQLVEEDLVDVAESGLAALGLQVNHSKVEIVREYTHRNARVEIDVHQMVTVFLTLFDNAVRAMPDGGTITIRTRNPDPASIEVAVEDAGVGIEPEDQDRIFEPFFTRRDDGIGLGLALVSRILAQHAGRIRVESEPGQGSRFILSFQLKRPLDRMV